MKTPKRYQNKPIPLMPEDNVPDYDRLEIWWQRAKRKNRVKQLKRTIERLNNESIANYFHGYNAGLQHGIEIGFLQGSKKLSEDILFQRKENQK